MVSKQGSIFGGALLVAGTAIGGGILALPLLTAAGGFWPAVILYILCWLFMAGTAMLLVDIFLWSPKEVNLVSMAQMTLGLTGKVIAWFLYLFLFSSLTVAYLSGGGQILAAIFNITPQWASVLFTAVFAPFIWAGPWLIDRLNRLLTLALIVAFFIFVFAGISKIDSQLFSHHNFSLALLATPVVFTSFGFQGLVPTLTNYLGRDRRKTYLAIILGSLIPLAVYILWEALILGLLPLDLLLTAKQLGQTAINPLKDKLRSPWLYPVGQFFAFLTILTSFLGVSIALIDFLSDGLKIKKTPFNRLGLTFLILIPPLLFAIGNPCLFIVALHYGGGLGCALLLGLLPLVMTWAGRKRFVSKAPLWVLLIMTAFIGVIIALMLFSKMF